MGNKKLHDGRTIGIIFTFTALSISDTMVNSALSLLVGNAFQRIATSLVSNDFYSRTSRMTFILLMLALMVTIILSLILIKRKVLKTGQISEARIFGLLSIVYLIVQPLSFYIYWQGRYPFESDDGFFFYKNESYFFTSFVFIPLGMLFDYVINKALSKRPVPL